MKQKYFTPEISSETIEKQDVLCASYESLDNRTIDPEYDTAAWEIFTNLENFL